ncbi:exodeoxyribonuclease III [Rubritalea marina]|uniref:exodeoxyribonuclease III n=1 Tax=Rubritalea marina TaxID=361055 RepID=UPI000371AD14|nr:exodeoxyribonuclease III [Rubritalea marina]
MKTLISWNVNGIRAVLKKDFAQWFADTNPDVLCLQETKAREEQVELPLEFAGYHQFWNAADKPGYSGTLILSKEKPLSVVNGIGIEQHDTEGRVITAEYPDYYLVTVYTPNAQNALKRIEYRCSWDVAFLAYCQELEKNKPVIFCGDLNVAHQEIDLARPKENRKNPGFSDQERAGFNNIVEAGFIDTFRHFHPDTTEAYSWWSYRAGARARNVGWRIDYFCASSSLAEQLESASILDQVLGSDHCPVLLQLK